MNETIAAYVPAISAYQVAPFAILSGAIVVLLILDALLKPEGRDRILAGFTGVVLVATGLFFGFDILGGEGVPYFEGALKADQFGNLGALIICAGAFAYLVLAPQLVRSRRLPAGELYALLLFTVLGLTMLSVANELITAFICIEIVSLSLYVMVGIDRRSRKAGEAAFKYFILGAFASAFLVLGIAFIFGATGTTQLVSQPTPVEAIEPGTPAFNLGVADVLANGERLVPVVLAEGITPGSAAAPANLVMHGDAAYLVEPVNPLWVYLGFALLFVGMCFKLSFAPFHMWAPDVYEGAATITTMYIATASKVGVFAFLVHIIQAMSNWSEFPLLGAPLLGAVAILSMVWGNLAALVQTNIKRLLAYSSIAHGGYMLVGVSTLVTPRVLGDVDATAFVRDSLLFYLFAYTVTNVVAFGIVAHLGSKGEGDMQAYRGLGARKPVLAAAMTVAMISLIGLGIPGTIGFWGKWFIFKEAVSSGLIMIAVTAMVTSGISAYYYLRLVVLMYMRDPSSEAIVEKGEVVLPGFASRAVIGVATACVVIYGVFPGLFLAIGGRLPG